ncbi:MAG: PA2169 family four-helix-bundle protein [Rhodoferax sp.]|nr:PA2169 family four-helix-bundle protein [Rhodoferax sp.]
MNQSTMTPAHVISALNSLISLNRDDQKGFQEAAEKIEATEIKTYYLEQSLSRAQFVGELQSQVHSLGSEPEDKGTVSGALHRGWMNLKTALGGGDHAILVATESVEDHAISTYQKAITESLPADVRDIVERQFESVKQSHNKVKALRDSLKE